MNRRNTTQQLPLAVAQLLIKHIPPFRTMCNSDAMAITPVLHTHRHPPHPSKPTRSCPHSWTCPQMRFPCVHGPLAPVGHGAHWRSSASGTLLGGSSHVCSQSHRQAPRWWGQEIVLGHGRAEVEGRLKDCTLIVRSRCRRTDQVVARSTGQEPAWYWHQDTQGDFMCECGWQEVVLIIQPARAFCIVGVVEDYSGALDPSRRFGPIQRSWATQRGLGWTGGVHVGRGG